MSTNVRATEIGGTRVFTAANGPGERTCSPASPPAADGYGDLLVELVGPRGYITFYNSDTADLIAAIQRGQADVIALAREENGA